MTRELEMLSDLIGVIYDTTLDGALWPDVLARLSEFVGGSAASLFSKSPTISGGNSYFDVGIEASYRQLYFEKYVKLDPASTGQYFADIGQPIATADFIPYDEFVMTRFYREWARPQGWIDFVSTVLDRSATSAAMFGIFRHEREGIVDEEARGRMRLVIPHVRRAVVIGNVIDLRASEATRFADTLQGLAAGVFLVDANARMIFANTAGQALLDARTAVAQENGALAAMDSRATAALRDAIGLARDGDAAVGTRGIAIPLSFPPEDIWLAHVLPLTSGIRREAGKACAAPVAVFVRQASLEIPSALETLSRLYRLTPAELRVLAAVSEAGSISAVADIVGKSEATVKTHLQHLFAKTGTSRQADLVRLVAVSASPLRPEG